MKKTLSESVIEIKNCTLHYWLGGDETAPLLVFSHGAYVDHDEWAATFPLALEKGYRVLTWDMRGHGASRPGNFSIRQSVEDLTVILDHLQVTQATFIGHSLGGNLHQEFVFMHPERVKALVIVDSTWNFQKLSRLDEWGVKTGLSILGWYPYNTLIKQMAEVTVSKPEDQAYFRKVFSTLPKEEFVHIMAEATLCLHEEPGYTIPKPFMLMVGDHDTTGNIRKVAPLFAKHEPNCTYVVIPNAKHGAHMDAPEFFHKELFEYLERYAR